MKGNFFVLVIGTLFFNSCISIKQGLVEPVVQESIELENSKYLEIKNQSYDISEEDFSISFWVNSVSSKPQMIIQKGGNNGADDPQYWIRLNDSHGKLTFLTGNGDHNSSFISSKKTLVDGEWHHVLAKRIKGEMSLYINGKLEITEEKTIKNCSNNQTLKIGVQIYEYPRNHFEGKIYGLTRIIHHLIYCDPKFLQNQGFTKTCISTIALLC